MIELFNEFPLACCLVVVAVFIASHWLDTRYQKRKDEAKQKPVQVRLADLPKGSGKK